MKATLSDTAIRVLEFLHSYIADRGFAPSYREICDGAEVSSTSEVARHLSELGKAGYIRRIHGLARAIALLDSRAVG